MNGLARLVVAFGMVGFAVVVPMAPVAAVSADVPPLSTTPQLLDRAVAIGEIDQATADLHLAEIFAGRGQSDKVPDRFQSDRPWDGSLPLLRLRERLAGRRATPTLRKVEAAAAAVTSCSSSTNPLGNEVTSAHFYLTYDAIGGGLTAANYLTSLETSYATQVTSFGWAAPPSLVSPPPAPIGTKYPVRTDVLTGGLYGFVSTTGTGAGFVGNNPNTTWDDQDSFASCMVLNRDFTGFTGSPQQSLDASTAHEFNHAIQYGYGAIFGPNVPDDSLFEASSTLMEDEVFDAANDNYGYLWPEFRDSLGDYDAKPYALWLMLRGLTERFGVGVAGGGEQVMQDFWESTSKGTRNNLSALAFGLENKGVTLADAYHGFAIGAAFMRTCGGGYALPYCFEEAASYIGAAGGLPPVAGSLTAVGNGVAGVIEDDYSLAWITLPAGTGYTATLANTASGGQLRATAVCDTGTTLIRAPFPNVVTAGGTTTLSGVNTTGCVRTLAVITNQQQSPGNPEDSVSRSFTLTTAVPTQQARGYRLVANDGGIFGFGDAGFFGSTGAVQLVKPIVGMASSPSGKGYWLVASDGGIFAFGDAGFFGSTGAVTLNKPIVGMAASPSGKGYRFVASDGGIFAFGDAAFFGSTGAIQLAKPIVGMAVSPSGKGYWFVASDGGIFSFGDARFFGSTGGTAVGKSIVGMAASPTGSGYWFVTLDGAIFNFGDAQFFGSTGGVPLTKPIVGMAV